MSDCVQVTTIKSLEFEEELLRQLLEPLPMGPPLEPLPMGPPLEALPMGPPLEPLPMGPPLEPLSKGPPLEPLSMGPPLEPVEVLPNVQYSFGNLAHAGPLRVRKNRTYVYILYKHIF